MVRKLVANPYRSFSGHLERPEIAGNTGGADTSAHCRGNRPAPGQPGNALNGSFLMQVQLHEFNYDETSLV